MRSREIRSEHRFSLFLPSCDLGLRSLIHRSWKLVPANHLLYLWRLLTTTSWPGHLNDQAVGLYSWAVVSSSFNKEKRKPKSIRIVQIAMFLLPIHYPKIFDANYGVQTYNMYNRFKTFPIKFIRNCWRKYCTIDSMMYLRVHYVIYIYTTVYFVCM